MKEIITFYPVDSDKTILPIQYNHMVQGMIYNLLKKDVASFLHEEGFKNEKRAFKMFTFSRITGNYFLNKRNGEIIFKGPVSLTVSSPYNKFSNSIGNNLLFRQKVRLGNNYLEVKKVTVEKEIVDKEEIRIRTLSPISTYSTLFRKDGKKFTYYYNPYEKYFSQTINNNLKNKYKAFYSEELPKNEVKIKPIGKTKMSVVKYKGFIIKGYTGKFNLTGPIPLLQLGIDTGLGSKNSQGFGCVEII